MVIARAEHGSYFDQMMLLQTSEAHSNFSHFVIRKICNLDPCMVHFTSVVDWNLLSIRCFQFSVHSMRVLVLGLIFPTLDVCCPSERWRHCSREHLVATITRLACVSVYGAIKRTEAPWCLRDEAMSMVRLQVRTYFFFNKSYHTSFSLASIPINLLINPLTKKIPALILNGENPSTASCCYRVLYRSIYIYKCCSNCYCELHRTFAWLSYHLIHFS